jgi:CRISPR-associated exonuclease Cas4
VVWRTVNLVSYNLGFSGRADMVEFRQSNSGVSLPGKEGFWTPFPVEYKRGKPKPDERDEVQLCAQAMCLEEMFETQVFEGALYYGEIRRRSVVTFSENLRDLVSCYAKEMHRLFDQASTPPPLYKPHCHSCSLYDVCLPKQMGGLKTADQYLKTELS